MKARLFTALLALALSTGAAHGAFGQGKNKFKGNKVKDKRFETVVRQDPRDYEGTYVGIEPDYVIEIRATAGGVLEVKYMEDGNSAAVTNVKLAGAHLTADLAFQGGRTGRLNATFSNRILNGETAFGLVVEDLDVHMGGGTTLNRVFFIRR